MGAHARECDATRSTGALRPGRGGRCGCHGTPATAAGADGAERARLEGELASGRALRTPTRFLGLADPRGGGCAHGARLGSGVRGQTPGLPPLAER